MIWHHHPNVAWVDEVDQVVLIDVTRAGDAPQMLNGPAATIWREIDGVRDEPALIAAVAAGYAQPAEAIAEDVHGFIRDLTARGLIEK